jgi:predicted CXXCH cytochrome family protein
MPCHTDIASSFGDSPMHRMTRLASHADIRAPFEGETLRFKDETATLETKSGARFVRLARPGAPERTYRVTRVLGGRYREDFVGVPVASEEQGAALSRPIDHGDELVLPVSYLIGQRRLRYKGYSVLVRERRALEPGPVWNRTCLLCHNTAPYLVSLLGALAGHGSHPYQGEVVDLLLDGRRSYSYAVTDAGLFSRAVLSEVERESGSGVDVSGGAGDVARRGINAVRDRLTGSGLLEVGIGCESCHGGSAEHVRSPETRPSFLPVAPFLSVQKTDGKPPTRAELVNHACARCHQVLFSRYPFTWEGGKRYAMPGGSEINSGEGRDFLLGACSGAMSCTACHDPHAKDEQTHLLELATPKGNRVCLTCHAELGSAPALRAHSHHDPSGAGGSCIACHMPKKNLSLDTGLTRYHRIGSPTDPARVYSDRPLECALCHADKSATELVSTMQKWWNKAYETGALRALYGDGAESVLVATLERGKPHEKGVAMAVLSEALAEPSAARGAKEKLAPLFARELANEYPLIREFARLALLRAVGATDGAAPCDLSMYAALPRLEKDADACLRKAGLPLPTWGLSSEEAPLPGTPPSAGFSSKGAVKPDVEPSED